MTLVHKFCCPWKLGASFCDSINLARSFISLLCQFSSELHFMAYFNLTDLTWVCSGGGLGVQLWLVLHICAGTCILGSHLLLWVQSKAHPESLENLLQALCCTDGVTWAHQGIPYVSQLPSSNHVQVHQGCSTSSPWVFLPSMFLCCIKLGPCWAIFLFGLGVEAWKDGCFTVAVECWEWILELQLCVWGGSFSLWAGIASNGNGNMHPRFQTEVLISWVCVSDHVCCFTLADTQASPDFSILGVVMVVAALVLDAFVGNFQEVIFLRNPATTQVLPSVLHQDLHSTLLHQL
jgi:hypothetical protein